MRSPFSHVIRFAVAGCLMTTAAANADQASGFTIVPSVGYHMFDRDTMLENDYYGSLGMGYTFSRAWGLELTFQQGSADTINATNTVDIEQLRLDALYHFARDAQVQPFLLIGGGNERWDNGSSIADNSIINAGAGLKVWFSESVSLRTDMRIINDTDNELTSFTVGLGFNMLLGGTRPTKTIAPLDGDGDGIIDNEDQCPNTAPMVEVDSSGCEIILDDDQDGVRNETDDCPDTSTGAKVDQSGCYIMMQETKEIGLLVDFETNSSTVTKDSHPEIERVAHFMREYPMTDANIEGHTDDTGAAAYNQWLSQQRANAVVKILTDHYGIDPSRLSATGYGQSRPIVVNNSDENRAKNRRVTAKLTAQVERIAR